MYSLNKDKIPALICDSVLLFENIIADEFAKIDQNKAKNMKNYLKYIIFLIRDFERPIKELFNQTNGLTSELFFRVLAKAAKLLESNEPNLEIEKCYLFILHLLNTIP